MTNNDLIGQIAKARKVSTPILFVRTADPAALLVDLVGDREKQIPGIIGDDAAIQWDLVRGIRGLNAKGAAAAQQLTEGNDPAAVSAVPTDALRLLAKAPRGSVSFFLNANRYWDAPDVVQAIWNLRDPYKTSQRCLLCVGPSSARVPVELEQDVITFDQPLPGREDLGRILDVVHKAAKLAVPVDRTREKIVDALAGLSAFSAEQIAAMSLEKTGLDLANLRTRRRAAIENTPGLSIYRGTDTFANLGGLSQIKKFFGRLASTAKEPIKSIAFIDEMDKAVAGAGAAGGPGDNTGIAQDQLRAMLTNIQDTGSKGAMLFGVPGAGKTAFVKALATELGVELVQWDLGAMMVSAAGGSQERIRGACEVQNAIGQGQTLWIATCNSTATIPTELRRRFRRYGEWYFDLPQADETPSIVDIYLKKFKLEVTGANPLPDLSEWTGAEIESLFYIAYNLDLSFREAADFVIPMKVSAADVVARLRSQATGRFLSVSRPGFYCGASANLDAPTRSTRSINLEDVAAAVAFGGMKES